MREKTATVIKADGTRYELGHKPSYDEASKIVGGMVEVARCEHDGQKVQLIVNEEGLLKRLPYNAIASNIYTYSPIVGDVILLKGWRFT